MNTIKYIIVIAVPTHISDTARDDVYSPRLRNPILSKYVYLVLKYLLQILTSTKLPFTLEAFMINK